MRCPLPSAFAVLLTAPCLAQVSVYDFNTLAGSDVHPFTPLDGQDGWSAETYNASNPCGVTATLGYDGSPCLRFQEVGPGYGTDASRINDPSWAYPTPSAADSTIELTADIYVGYWGGGLGFAHDTGGNGQVRGNEPGERGVRFLVGSNPAVGLRLYRADGTFVQAPLAGVAAGGEWLTVTIKVDLFANSGAGSGSVQVKNLTQGAPQFSPVAGLQGIDLALDRLAADATNPLNWDALWLHFEGATYMLDNVLIGVPDLGFAICSSVVPNSTGLPGGLTATGSSVAANNDLTLHALYLPTNQFGYFLCSGTVGFIPNPAGSAGNLCLSGAIGRYNSASGYSVLNSGAAGAFSLPVDLTNTPHPAGAFAITAGTTYNFQAWYRDGSTSNFTEGIQLVFQ